MHVDLFVRFQRQIWVPGSKWVSGQTSLLRPSALGTPLGNSATHFSSFFRPQNTKMNTFGAPFDAVVQVGFAWALLGTPVSILEMRPRAQSTKCRTPCLQQTVQSKKLACESRNASFRPCRETCTVSHCRKNALGDSIFDCLLSWRHARKAQVKIHVFCCHR